jgi:hypothetical protein
MHSIHGSFVVHVHQLISVFRHRQFVTKQPLTLVARGDRKSSLSNDSKLGP